jgi:Domain of unknown function (DUF4386)
MERLKQTSVKEDRTTIAFSIRKTDRYNAIITGCFFIAATAAAITAVLLYSPLLTHSNYLVEGAANSGKIVSGAVFELILVASACGTAIMLYPYLKVYNERLAFGYATFRILEAVAILTGLLSMFSLLSLSRLNVHGDTADAAIYSAIGSVLKAVHEWTSIVGPKFFLGINTFLYSYVFYQSSLVPKKIALAGIAGACLVFTSSMLELFGVIDSLSTSAVLLAIPVAAYEMILAGWLIIKGFGIYYVSRADHHASIKKLL